MNPEKLLEINKKAESIIANTQNAISGNIMEVVNASDSPYQVDVFPKKIFVINDFTNIDFSDEIKQSGLNISKRRDFHKEDYDGFLYQDDGGIPKIFVDDTLDSNQQIFTVFHELGHLILEQKWFQGKSSDSHNRNLLAENNSKILDVRADKKLREKIRKTDQKLPENELQADEFAAAIMMPRSIVMDIIEANNGDGLKSARMLSDLFGVSNDFADKRIENVKIMMSLEK